MVFFVDKIAKITIIYLYRWGYIHAYRLRNYVKLRPRFGDVLGRGFT